MKPSNVTLQIRIPEVDYTEQELIEWLKWHLGQTSTLSAYNDLYDIEPEDCRISIDVGK